jgi:hypothetical protein
MDKTEKALDDFIKKTFTKEISDDGKEETICDTETGECYVIRTKDGIVERINKKYVTEDGRQLLQD